MPLTTPAPPNKRKKANKIITDLSNQNLENLLMCPPPVPPKPEMPKEEVVEETVDEEAEREKRRKETALPFGGFEKGSKMLTFEIPDISLAPEEPEPLPPLQADIRSRPSFNRTPIGWVCSEDNSNIHMDLDNIPFDGETDDL
eukprot:superscaffoldBa00005008_g19773